MEPRDLLSPQMQEVARRFDALAPDANPALEYLRDHPEQSFDLTLTGGELHALLNAIKNFSPEFGSEVIMLEQMSAHLPPEATSVYEETIARSYVILGEQMNAAGAIIAAWRSATDPVPDEVPAWLSQ